MNRRNFFKSKVAGTAILASSGLVCKASAENPPTVNDNTSILDVDVLVVGGGSAGHVAAIQAGRLGAKTVLLERNSQLGGTTTTGGVCFPGLFHAWGKQVISGIGWELVAKSVEVDGRKLQDLPGITGHMFRTMWILMDSCIPSWPRKRAWMLVCRLLIINIRKRSLKPKRAGW